MDPSRRQRSAITLRDPHQDDPQVLDLVAEEAGEESAQADVA
jgi:hypothetical protein